MRELCKKIRIRNFYFYLSFALITLVLIFRAFYGIEITDEAYYIAESRTVSEGNVPFVYNNSTTVGMTILMTPFTVLHKLFSPSYDGYFLYMRLCYILCKAGILLLCFNILVKSINSFYAGCGILILLAHNILSLQNFSYNTISLLFILTVGIILYHLEQKINSEKYPILYWLAGVMSSIAVFSHPVYSVSIIFLIVMLLIFKHFKECLFYIGGGVSHIFLYFFSCIAQADIHTFFQGLIGFYTSFSSADPPQFHSIIAILWKTYHQMWILMLCVIIVVMLAILLPKAIRENSLCLRDNLSELHYAALISLYISLIAGSVYILCLVPTDCAVSYFGAVVAVILLILFFLFPTNKALWLLGMTHLLFTLAEIFGTASLSVFRRFHHLVPALLPLFVISSDSYKTNKNVSQCLAYTFARQTFSHFPKKLLVVIALCLSVSVELYGLLYIYRDQTLPHLTCRVEQGVYRGINTTEKRALDIIELDKYLKSITQEDEYISFRDNVPVGYLLMNGKACDQRTWDCMLYTQHHNNPSVLYDYYERRGHTPDKIIYIDFGRDKQLSIDDENFKYNEFVKTNYVKQSDIHLNETFKRVICFVKK